jgi:hypothetical protein
MNDFRLKFTFHLSPVQHINYVESLRLYNVLNIAAEESKVFSTKERAPFYICIEIFNPAEQLTEDEAKKLEEIIDQLVTMRSSSQHFSEGMIYRRSHDLHSSALRKSATVKSELLGDHRHQTEALDSSTQRSKSGKFLTNKLLEFTHNI